MLKRLVTDNHNRGASRARVIKVYTDGGAIGNPGPGGYAATWACRGRRRTVVGGAVHTTNNRMALKAIECALRKCPRDRHLVIHSDSRYAIDGLTKWRFGWERRRWKTSENKPVANLDLWKAIINRIERRGGKVEFVWVKGHAGNPMNERVDRLANGRARRGGTRKSAHRSPGLRTVAADW